MKRVLYIVRRPPGVLADEFFDVTLVSGVFEQPTSVLFADRGVYQLLGLAARESPIKTLSSYDIKDLYVAEESMTSLGLDIQDIPSGVHTASRRDVRELIAHHDVVLTD
ncbi:MAG: DsrE family protein [Pseudomonadales bacterium]|nr:DsrE family protein [Pseudomonadales bacterium]